MLIAACFLAVDCLLITACSREQKSETDLMLTTNSETEESVQELFSEVQNSELHVKNMELNESYFLAYQDFLLNAEIDQENDFPIWGYYLFDMNFDGIPELGVLHDSGGSMGGYFTFYRYDGKEIIPAMLNRDGNPVQISNYTQILADYDSQKVYFLKEMYLLIGNENGTYGYIMEVTDENGVLYCNSLLNLEVDCDPNAEICYEVQHDCEDDFLSDSSIAKYLNTESYSDGVWEKILPEEYLARKRELVPEENSFADLRDTDAYFLLCNSVYELMDNDGNFHNRRMTEEEIVALLKKWIEHSKIINNGE